VGVDVQDIDVTNVNDERPRFVRRPHVIVKAKPGSDWG
jgi:hypothetical protein